MSTRRSSVRPSTSTLWSRSSTIAGTAWSIDADAPLGLAALLYLFAMERWIPFRADWQPVGREWRRDGIYFGINGLVSTAVTAGRDDRGIAVRWHGGKGHVANALTESGAVGALAHLVRSLSSIFARFTLRLSTANCWRRTTFSRASRDRSASSALMSARSSVIQRIVPS